MIKLRNFDKGVCTWFLFDKTALFCPKCISNLDLLLCVFVFLREVIFFVNLKMILFFKGLMYFQNLFILWKSDSLYCLTLCYQGNNWAQFTFCGLGIIPDTFLNISYGILFLICFPRLYCSTSFVYFSYLFYYYYLFSS